MPSIDQPSKHRPTDQEIKYLRTIIIMMTKTLSHTYCTHCLINIRYFASETENCKSFVAFSKWNIHYMFDKLVLRKQRSQQKPKFWTPDYKRSSGIFECLTNLWEFISVLRSGCPTFYTGPGQTNNHRTGCRIYTGRDHSV